MGAGVALPGALAADAEGLSDDRPTDAGGPEPGDLSGDLGVEALPSTDQEHQLRLALLVRGGGPLNRLDDGGGLTSPLPRTLAHPGTVPAGVRWPRPLSTLEDLWNGSRIGRW